MKAPGYMSNHYSGCATLHGNFTLGGRAGVLRHLARSTSLAPKAGHVHVLIVEPDLTGHHGAYLVHMIEALFELGLETTVALPSDAEDRPEYEMYLAAVRDKAALQCVVDRGSHGALAAAYAKAAAIRDGVRRFAPDHLLVPYIDGLSQVATLMHMAGMPAIPRGLFSEGLLFRGGFAYGQQLPPRARLLHRAGRELLALSPWSVIHFLDPLPFDDVRRRGGGLSVRARLMPDPVEASADIGRREARRSLGLAEDGHYIVMAGLINRRKGADLLLHAFQRAGFPSDVRLLLAGSHTDDIRALLADKFARMISDGQVISLDTHLPTDQLILALAAADLICAPYPNHIGSASLLIRAAAARRPVLSSTFGWNGHMTQRYGLGWTCSVLDDDQLTQGLHYGLDRSVTWQQSEAGRRFSEFHSISNFRAHWTSEIRERLGLPEHPSKLSWKWVNQA